MLIFRAKSRKGKRTMFAKVLSILPRNLLDAYAKDPCGIERPWNYDRHNLEIAIHTKDSKELRELVSQYISACLKGGQ